MLLTMLFKTDFSVFKWVIRRFKRLYLKIGRNFKGYWNKMKSSIYHCPITLSIDGITKQILAKKIYFIRICKIYFELWPQLKNVFKLSLFLRYMFSYKCFFKNEQWLFRLFSFWPTLSKPQSIYCKKTPPNTTNPCRLSVEAAPTQ